MTLRKLVLTILLTFAAPSAVAIAQEGSATSTPAAAMPKKEIPPGFEPIAGKEARAETVSASLLVVVAYGAFFFFLFGYVVMIVRAQNAIGQEMKSIADKIGRGQGS